ncbi:MAG: hypothetical protein M0P61_18260 [Ignavibacteriaceae bacterium]|jgi:hypothetical protein|nr:hypothetical protein [Ignavibacteriaceae bacterium]
MTELSNTFEHDCGMDAASWRVRVKNDFGEDAVEPFEQEVILIEGSLERAKQSVDPETNTNLLLHQMIPEVFPDPMKPVKRNRHKK